MKHLPVILWALLVAMVALVATLMAIGADTTPKCPVCIDCKCMDMVK